MTTNQNPETQNQNVAEAQTAEYVDPYDMEVDPTTYLHAGTSPVLEGAERWLLTYTASKKLTDEEADEADAAQERLASGLGDEDEDDGEDPEDDGEDDTDDEDENFGDEDENFGDEDEDEDEEDDEGEDEELRQSAGPYYGERSSTFIDVPAGLLPSQVEAIFAREAANIPGLIPEGFELDSYTAHYIVVEKVIDLSTAAVPEYDADDEGDDEDADGHGEDDSEAHN